MPNHIILASGAVVAVSVVVATAIAIYENPDLRRYSEDGFLETRRGAGAEPGVDADEDSRRRQREELMYWNSMLLKKQQDEKEAERQGEKMVQRPRGTSFDDFMKPAPNSEEGGAYVIHSGAQVHDTTGGLRNRTEGMRGFAAASAFANPFADEFTIGSDYETEAKPSMHPSTKAPSDIYSATTKDDVAEVASVAPSSNLIEFDEPRSLDEIMIAGQEGQEDAYSSIQAWARESSRNFYSPLPETPQVARSEATEEEEDSSDEEDGQLTPTDSVSVIGSQISRPSETLDVLSESSGMMTPASWSEVGSVISESEANGPIHS
ncbi:hypothetical protein VHEMI04627 [[Torrubiella] hemipterigena]|uniref:Uncharacterized protein n=1 Tax=[Torrubiella] hemipterigena TaxID=1531966 RepID=A0A0A1TEG3_9HYPO|nr:hypothetical protein VHEMI04627 [[Torrubiella] hemipterigena]